MRRAVTVGSIACLLAGALLAAAPAWPAPSPRPDKPSPGALGSIERPLPRWVPGRVLVEFRKGVGPRRAAAWAGARGALVADRIPFFDVGVVRLPPGLSVPEAVERFRRSPAVRSVQPDLLLRSFADPGDRRFDEQWALDNTGQLHPVSPSSRAPNPPQEAGTAGADIDALRAWDTQTGREETVIAVVDSGVDVAHPEIAPSLWVNRAESEGEPGEDDDRNGHDDDVHGWDFADDDNTLLEERVVDGYEHGTHVAGIAAAAMDDAPTTDTSGEIAGVCPDCSIMVLKFMRRRVIDGEPTLVGPMSAELEALDYARRNGADIVNTSFGGYVWAGIERRAFQRLGRAGVLTVAAAGNENGDNDMFLTLNFDGNDTIDSLSPLYPASYDIGSIISVAASNHNDEYGYHTTCANVRDNPRWPCTFTNWGHVSVDVAAPGVDILSSIPGDAYDVYDGTSMAAPHVAGVAGLVKSEHPRWGPRRIKSALLESVDKPDGLDVLRAFPTAPTRGGGFTATDGRVNARGALAAEGESALGTTDGTVRGARKLGRVARGRVAWPRDVNDVYRKRLVKGRRYEVILRGPAGEDFDLFVYKPGAKEIWQIGSGCYLDGGSCKLAHFGATVGAAEDVRLRARRSGTYIFQVSSFFSSGRYRLRIARI